MTASVIAQQEARAERFEAIAAADRQIAQAFARRAELVEEARRYGQSTAALAARVPGSRWDATKVAEREFVSELACTLRLPQRTAESVIAESRALAEELPATRDALHKGEISYRHEYKARLLRERLHPETLTARHTASIADRRVIFQPEADGMASLLVYDTADNVRSAYLRITDAALSLQGPNEPRTLTQLRADVLSDLLLGGVTPSGIGKGIRATANVTVPVLTLLGLSEEAGHLEGYGPIDPETGVVLSVGRDSYKVPKALKRWLRIRDETCRFPGCNQAAGHSDLDHSLDWQFQGLTAHDNLAHLCPGCHALKSETGWSLKHLADGRLEWTSPAGRVFTTEPATVIPNASPPPGRPGTEPDPDPPRF